ncbi:MAG TPA: serine protease HtrA [Clostridiales bacterium]|nr:serine protease HtrA [Clostridiales bacterium]
MYDMNDNQNGMGNNNPSNDTGCASGDSHGGNGGCPGGNGYSDGGYASGGYSEGFVGQSSTTYHFSNTPGMGQAPKKEKKGAGRAVALVLCCALVGGAAGVGGAAVYSAVNRGGDGDGTVIYQNKVDPTPVDVRQADGLTPMSLSEIYAAYADSCVCITVQAVVQQGYYQYQASGAGSGFIISEDGYIVTNYHVIDGATSIKVTLNNGESYDAKLVGGEELNDVAVLKIDGVTGLKPVVLGDSDDVVVGETVCTIGNALGTLSFSQTSGGVSATDRSVTMSDGTVINMIQTDCTINSGNSGGPLFDSYGRVVGITSAKLSNNGSSSDAAIEGIGFAIPINDVINIITDYIQYGYVTGRPYMGIQVSDISQQYMQAFGWPAGVYVNSVEEGSCAQTSGLKQGDIITKIDDTDITGVAQMSSVKNSYTAGDTVTLTVFRSGEYLTLTMTFDEQDNQTAQGSQSQQGNQGQGQLPNQGGQSGTQDPEPSQSSMVIDPWSYFFGGRGW